MPQKTSTTDDDRDVFGEKKSHWATSLGFKMFIASDVVKQLLWTKNGFDHNIPTTVLGTVLKYGISYPLVFLNDNFYTKLALVLIGYLSGLGMYASEHTAEAGIEVEKAQKQGIPLTTQPKLMGLPRMNTWLNKAYVSRLLLGKSNRQDKAHTRSFAGYVAMDLKRATKASGYMVRDTDRLMQELFKKAKNPTHYTIKVPDIYDVWVPKTHRSGNFKKIENTFNLCVGNSTIGFYTMLVSGLSHLAGQDTLTNMAVVPIMFGTKAVEFMGSVARSNTMSTLDNTAKSKAMAGGHLVQMGMHYAGMAGWSTSWMLGLTKLGNILSAPWETYKQLSKVKQNNTLQKDSLEKASSLSKLAIGTTWSKALLDGVIGGLIVGAPLIDRYEKKHHVSLNPFSPDFVYIKHYKKEKALHTKTRVPSPA